MGQKILLQSLILLIPSILLFPKGALAADEEFSTTYSVTYDFSKSAPAKVDFQITILNLTNMAYVKEYTLSLASGSAGNFRAVDQNGEVPMEKKEDGRTIKIKNYFGDKIVGKGAFRDWHIYFEDGDAAKKNGLIWNISVPKFEERPPLSNYSVKLIVPEDFGPEVYSSPNNARVENLESKRIYYFEGKDLIHSGIFLNFGRYQLYQFDLKYHLKNPNIFPSEIKIALPPNIRAEQEVYLKEINPPPADIEIDADGNYLAVFPLRGTREIVVNVSGYARITHPKRDLALSGSLSEIPSSLTKAYLSEQPYWETNDGEIKDIVRNYAGESRIVSDIARNLFEYTIQNLKYSQSRVDQNLTRFGAKKALQNKDQAVCMEFADLLTTLLRASGIPAQVVEGYAFTDDETNRPVIGDVLHSWVRYYDPRLGWISVDPTWSATSGLDYFGRLDTNHFTFAIKGLSSTIPYPAGAYKISPSQTGDIKVRSSDKDLDFPALKIELGVSAARTGITSLFSPKVSLTVANRGGLSAFDVRIRLNSDKAPIQPQTLRLGDLPAYSQKIVNLSLQNDPFREVGSTRLSAELSFTNFDGDYKRLDWNKEVKLPSTLALIILTPSILLALCLWGYLLLRARRASRKK